MLGRKDFLVLEARDTAGGLASSCVDAEGFTWDRGGHVVFSHFGEFDRLLVEMLGDELLWHDRSSYVHVSGRFIPYPFQNNPPPSSGRRRARVPRRSRRGANLVSAAKHGESRRMDVHDVRRWDRQPLHAPLQRKGVWGTSLDTMSADWVAERVSVVD
jgi:phytoene dehydrogenase-like protein